MIELLEDYRAAKIVSMEAAKELGRAIGELFYREHFRVPEIETFLQTPSLSNPPTFDDLNKSMIGNLFQESLNGFIDASAGLIGVDLGNPILARDGASRVPLEESSFLDGFVEGMRKLRNQRNR